MPPLHPSGGRHDDLRVPGRSSNWRLLPDHDPEVFLRELETVINDPSIRIERIMGFMPAVSPTDTPRYRAIADVTRRHYPAANIIPAVETGFTDNHSFRDLGIASYGFAPYVIPAVEESGIHGPTSGYRSRT